MKAKDIFSPFILVLLGLAFLSISLWVILSGHKNAKAIRYKYKIGGMILSLSFFTSACDRPPFVTCYDPAPPENSIYLLSNSNSFSVNDSLFFTVSSPSYPKFSYLLQDSVSKDSLQKGWLEYSEEKYRYFIPLDENLDYKGKVVLQIFGELTEEIKQKDCLYSDFFILNDEED